jgi:hypothetical protein
MGISCRAVKGRWGGLYGLGGRRLDEWLAENISSACEAAGREELCGDQ